MFIYIIRTTVVSLVSRHDVFMCICIAAMCFDICKLFRSTEGNEIPTFENYRISNFYRDVFSTCLFSRLI